MAVKKNQSLDGRQVFGALLRALREFNDVTPGQAALIVGYSESMLEKIERGERNASPEFIDEIEKLLALPGVLEPTATRLREQRHPDWFGEYAEREGEAVSLWSYTTNAVHGLLQTREYAHSVLSAYAPTLDDEEVERRVQARLDRQELLTRKPAVNLSQVILESVLRQPIGGPAVMKAQLGRLLDVSAMRNASVQVMPLSHGAHPGMDGPFTLMETASQEWVAYVEGPDIGHVIDSRKQVSQFQVRYGMIRTQALNEADSRRLIEEMIREL
ncbi:helix-turn-helix domain-containing protein [Streptomyces hainanensis]|uniref:XRE family transcriptional regulator n=1 Tax=Streptomyces hainanensis TaxID=402648 RepID=A0A4R4TR92_9ACTN|nr:helix-turn-helix transcriptional regulator [Streptomyces hainanensis]TDC79276.1 XRE family transcriptional regulator [Streptomyces hainanensis]